MGLQAISVALVLSAAAQSTILDAHNRERARLGEAPLAWNDALARGAADWARHLAGLGRLEHSAGRDGENLWMGTAGGYRTEEMVAGWIDEKKDFVPGKFPDVSRTGDMPIGAVWVSRFSARWISSPRRMARGMSPASDARFERCSSHAGSLARKL